MSPWDIFGYILVGGAGAFLILWFVICILMIMDPKA